MDNELDRLAALDTCAVSDALDAVGLSGVLLGLSAVSGDRRIVGRAATVRLGPAGAGASGRHLCTAAVESSGPRTIIMVAHEGRTDVAGWGGLLSLGASINGVEGVVIDGACRDLDESRELGLVIHARAALPITARGRIVEVGWDVPVDMAGIRVAPGDLVIADGSGVVVIPQTIAGAVITKAEAVAAKERAMAEAIRAGEPVSKVMGAKYENMVTEISR